MKVKPEVLTVLATCTFDGQHAFLPGQQLDRKLYLATDEVLKACGGQWSRKARAHVFNADARERIELVLTTGEVQTASDIGYFPTPDPLAAELVAMADVQPGHRVLEPSAGRGAIVMALQKSGGLVTMIERDFDHRVHLVAKVLRKGLDALVSECTDFMLFTLHGAASATRPDPRYDRVVMNPPFGKVGLGDHLDHVQHAHSLLAPSGKLVSVLPTGVTFRDDRRHREFREWIIRRGGLIEDLPEDSFRESGTRVRTCVVRIGA